jgi:hypothetical protein
LKENEMNGKRNLMLLAVALTASGLVGGLTTSWPTSSLVYAKGKPASKQTVHFAVDVTGDIELVGTFNSDGTVNVGDVPDGRAGDRVIVNGPSPALRMDFLAGLDPVCVPTGTIYSLDGSGTLSIGEDANGGNIRYFFRGYGTDLTNNTLVHYVLDAPAVIVGMTGGSFPKGDPVGYTVSVGPFMTVEGSNGKTKKLACEGVVVGAAEILLLRK